MSSNRLAENALNLAERHSRYRESDGNVEVEASTWEAMLSALRSIRSSALGEPRCEHGSWQGTYCPRCPAKRAVFGNQRHVPPLDQPVPACPCNGGCHNGHTPACSDTCRGQP